MKSAILLFLLSALLFSAGFTMPVRRTVQYTDTSGKSWRESGMMAASIVASQQAWELTLRRDGWRFVRVIRLDSATHKRLEVWQKNGWTLLLCLWSQSASSSGYMWGIHK